MKKILEQRKGITLIALVITIIVLLILAGVSIAMLTGENGIILQAQGSKEKAKFAEAEEKLILLLNEYKIRLSYELISFYDFFLEKKRNNEIQDIIDNFDGTYWIMIDNYEFLVKAEDLTILDKNKLEGEKPSITHEFLKEEDTGKIILKVSTNDSKGISYIKNPNGYITKYENQEKDVTMEYVVNVNGEYNFIIEAGNGRRCSYQVEVTGLAIFNESYQKDIDYQTVTQIYETAKKEQTEEQSKVVNQSNNLCQNANILAAEKNNLNNSWTVFGKSKTEKLNGYYIYDKYKAENKTTFKEGEWSSWQSSGFSVTSNISGYQYYSFNSTTGNFTVSGQASFSPYNNTHRYGPLSSTSTSSSVTVGTLVEYWVTSPKYGTPKYERRKTAIAETTSSKGDYLSDILLPDSYPEDGISEGFWYTKKSDTNEYYSYKFHNNDIKSIYNPMEKVIETKTMDLKEEIDNIKLKVKADNNDYKISILDNSEEWKEISDHTGLDTGKVIQLSKKSNKIKIRIELNSSNVDQIVVNKILQE